MSNDVRPGSGRVTVDPNRRDAIMKLLEENPNWGMNQAVEELDRLLEQRTQGVVKDDGEERAVRATLQPLTIQPEPAPSEAPPAPTQEDQTDGPDTGLRHADVRQPNVKYDPIEGSDAGSFNRATETPVGSESQPAAPLNAEKGPADVAPSPAPSFLPPDEPVPEKEAPPTEAPKAPAQKPLNLGKEAPRSEFAELEENDPQRILLGTGDLGGPMQSSENIGRVVEMFFNSIPRDDNGNPLFRSEEEESTYYRVYSALNLTSPMAPTGIAAFNDALRREGVAWEQHMTTASGRNAGWVRQNNAGNDAISAFRRKRRSGNPVNQWLPATGIFLEFRAPHERDFCDFDIQFAMETAKIGMNTYGLLMSASSGVYLRHMVEFALKFVISCSMELQGGDMKSVLIDKIDKDDYWLVIIGMLTAKFPSGIPWTLTCMNPKCDHTEDVKLNLIRATRLSNSQFTTEQRQLFERQSGDKDNVITMAEQKTYHQAHPAVEAARFEDDGVVVNFTRSTLGDYFDVTEEWAGEISDTTASALTDYATEKDRETHMRTSAESRRLTRYLHCVKSIEIHEQFEDDVRVTTETNREKIKQLLIDSSSDRIYVAKFEAAISKYTEACRVAVFGYMGRKCPSCGLPQDAIEDGPFRGIVTISPDRLFFALSRAVSEIQKLMLQQYESIG